MKHLLMTLAVALTAIVTAATLAACGSSDDPEDPQPPVLKGTSWTQSTTSELGQLVTVDDLTLTFLDGNRAQACRHSTTRQSGVVKNEAYFVEHLSYTQDAATGAAILKRYALTARTADGDWHRLSARDTEAWTLTYDAATGQFASSYHRNPFAAAAYSGAFCDLIDLPATIPPVNGDASATYSLELLGTDTWVCQDSKVDGKPFTLQVTKKPSSTHGSCLVQNGPLASLNGQEAVILVQPVRNYTCVQIFSGATTDAFYFQVESFSTTDFTVINIRTNQRYHFVKQQ